MTRKDEALEKEGFEMAVIPKKSKAQMLKEFERDQSSDIAASAIVRGVNSRPVAFRASAPLLAALDQVAQNEHRSRGNLIQYILWKYVREEGSRAGGGSREKSPKSKTR